MTTVRRLNHAVLFVRDLERSIAFYQEAFGFQEVARGQTAPMAFLRAGGSDNHHDLGLLALGPGASAPPRGAVGLYHLAWEVGAIHDLLTVRQKLADMGALAGQSDHGATKSLYGRDPDGNQFEVMWMVPRELWGEFESTAPVLPLDLEAEVARYG